MSPQPTINAFPDRVIARFMHKVYLANSDTAFDVSEGETILAAAQRQGLNLPFGCQSGTCGACRAQVTQGRVETLGEPPALSPAERDAGFTLSCLAKPMGEVHLDLHLPGEFAALRPQLWPARVIGKCWLAHDVIGLSLRLPQSERPLRWLAGQYLDVLTDDGGRRSFSIANASGSELIELHLRVVPGGRFANWVAHDMPLRTILRFEAPLGAFFIRGDTRRPMVFMAGGTGLAPVRAMLQECVQRGETRPMTLFWGARAQRDLYCDAELRELSEHCPSLRYVPVLSEPDADWQGARGWVHEAVLRHVPDIAGHELYMSGPPPMIEAGKRAFTEAGLDPARMYYDSFEYAYRTFPVANAP